MNFLELFNIIKNEFIKPFTNDLIESSFLENIIVFLNKLLNGVMNLFKETPPTEQIIYIDNVLIADILGLIIFVIVIYFIYQLFKFVFSTLKTFVVELKKEISLTAYLEKKGGRKKIKLWLNQW